MPLDLRYKKTRAIRRRLTTKEANAVTVKAHKKAIHFPKRSESMWRLSCGICGADHRQPWQISKSSTESRTNNAEYALKA